MTMEASVLLFLTLLLGFVVLLLRGHPKAHGHLPPGPRPLPFLGNLLQMDRRGLLNSFMRLREKYGDVFTVHLGPRPVVMLCGTEAIREALVDQAEAFSGRGTVAVFKPIFKEYGAPLDPKFLFQCITANIICSIVFGERFDYKDRQFLRLMYLFHQSFSLLSSFSSQVFELFSGFLKYFPGTHVHISRITQEILDYIERSVEQHQETLDPSNPRDLIDTYLLRMEKPHANPVVEGSTAGETGRHLACGITIIPSLTSPRPRKSRGKRICLGEGIARNELFLFFTTMLQNFSLSSPVDPKDIDLSPKESGFGRVPQEYQICFLSR
ncbi:hypothetical protein NN561_019689 [Cricetulus griseus]